MAHVHLSRWPALPFWAFWLAVAALLLFGCESAGHHICSGPS